MIMWFLILIIIALFIVLEVSHCIQYNNIREYKKAKKEICPGTVYHVCTNYWTSSDNPYVEPTYIDIEIISLKENKKGTLYVQYKLGDIDVNVDTFNNFFERYLKYDNKVVEPKNINYGFDSTRKVE